MKRLKEEKGSITLFVLVSMLFFVLFLAGMYMLSNAKEQTGISETAKIKQIYEKDVNNIDNVYATELRKYSIGDILKAGDYIKYDSGKNGVILCRVLYDANSEYGLQIISDKSVKQITLGSDDASWEKGKIAYNNSIIDLNNYAEEYINDEYAYDARGVGSSPKVEKGMFVEKDKLKFEGTEEYAVPSTVNTFSIPDAYTLPSGWTSRDTGCYKTDTNYTIDQTQMQAEELWTTGEYYWLASRYVYSDSSYCNFFVRYVYTDGFLSVSNNLCYIYSSGYPYGFTGKGGLRPCISLKYDKLKIVSGDGKSADTAYVIGK